MKQLKEILRIVLPLALGVVIFWWVYRKMDFSKILIILEDGVSFSWLLVSAVIGIISHVLRAIRWRMLVRLLGVKPTIYTLTNAVFINYGANLVFPRLGEVWRCVYVAKKEDLPITKVLGTMLSERLVDVAIVGLMICVGFFTMPLVFADFIENHIAIPVHIPFKLDVNVLYLGSAIAFVAVTYFYRKIEHSKWMIKLKSLMHEMWIGVKTLIVLPHKREFLFWTALLWTAYFAQLYVCFFAFNFTENLGLSICMSVFVMGTIAFGLPVQGGIGPWHLMVISTLVFYGIGATEAAAFALIVHTLQVLENAAVGVFAFFVTGTSEKDRLVT
ncbi:MAG: lysylphosphatidylglycerol synthase transmembrane domain-containing protein [Bacteroidales bacterium]|nr:lysylphosphatidylglycerol synthase transmembrane domain-containing protein [Bacteroidales bacterium]